MTAQNWYSHSHKVLALSEVRVEKGMGKNLQASLEVTALGTKVQKFTFIPLGHYLCNSGMLECILTISVTSHEKFYFHL
jgi:hypothetical protein